jgi:hypothetical protein
MKIPHRIEPFEMSRDVHGNTQGGMADPAPTTKGGLT